MRRLLPTAYLLTLLPLVSCIENDIPLPYIKGDVLEFEISGQKGSSKIDPSKNQITLELSDTVNIENSKISRMILSDGAKSTLQAGDYLNHLSDTIFTVSTYQDFQWTISVSQQIDRQIELSGQIGDAVIDLTNFNAAVYVSATQDLRAIVVNKFQLGPSNAVITPDPYLISDFSLPRTFTVSYHDKSETWEVVVIKTEEPVITGSANPWGLFAYLEADVKQDPNFESGFDYRAKGTQTWTYTKASVNGSRASAKIVGLNPNTSYEYRGSYGTDKGEIKEFTTDIIPTIENLSFDDWVLDGTKWFPNLTGTNSFWATGNEGVVTAGKPSNTTPVDGVNAVSGKAARLETIGGVILAKIAAGNLYTGIYTPGLPVEFDKMRKLAVMGRAYTGRPTKLKGWFKYSPKPVDIAADPQFPFTDSIGKMDWAHIYVSLEDWGGATERPAQTAITQIAYGEFRTNQQVDEYTTFEFPIEYNSLTHKPTHISIVATSSINGGDFCGGSGSVLHVDEFELVFE